MYVFPKKTADLCAGPILFLQTLNIYIYTLMYIYVCLYVCLFAIKIQYLFILFH